MSFTNTPERYGVISAAFHWLSAIIVYGMFALGLWMVTLSYYDGWYHKAPELHKSIGILLMMGLVIRVLWRVISPPPGPLPSYSPMTRLAAKAGHLALYLLLFAIGISGYRSQLPMVNRSAFLAGLTSPRPLPTLAHRQTLPVPCIFGSRGAS